jgi:hypothetical protein
MKKSSAPTSRPGLRFSSQPKRLELAPKEFAAFDYTEAALLLFAVNSSFARSKFSLGAAGAEALAAQNGPSARGLEGHGVRFAALVAGDLEALALAATPGPAPRPAETGAARVAARFAALRLAQVSLAIILLLSFGEGEGRTAFGTGNLDIWHRCFLPRRARLPFWSSALRFSLGAPGAPDFNGCATPDAAIKKRGAQKRQPVITPLSLFAQKASHRDASGVTETFERQRVYRTRGAAVQK